YRDLISVSPLPTLKSSAITIGR
ncbi:pseudopilin, partial [Yersinia pestis]|nr:pseudopilin [Yersinia pestis]